MLRLLFAKTGDAVWMSHLDLMRLFQRAFKRAGLELTHTQGYNPRPSVSIALPLSVGVESCCELLDFDLTGDKPSSEEIVGRLNAVLVKGVRVLQCFENGRKIRDLTLLRSTLTLEYDAGAPDSACELLTELFSRPALEVEKKGKNGPVQQDIIPMLRSIEAVQLDANTLQLRILACCQNPSLNPMQLPAAIARYAPELEPDFVRCRREEIYDAEQNVFR